MADITKPIVIDTDVWASLAEAGRDIIRPYNVYTGWTYEEKPSYQSLNWFWNQISQFLVHWNQRGIPDWDAETVYETGSIIRYVYQTPDGEEKAEIFQCIQQSKNQPPELYSRIWKNIQTLAWLKDVQIDIPEDYQIIVYSNEQWKNRYVDNTNRLDDVINVSIDTATLTPGQVLVTNSSNPDDADAWVNKDFDDILSNAFLNDIGDVTITNPLPQEVLQYKIITENEGTENETSYYQWINTYYKGPINWNNIRNTPLEFQPRPTSESQVGGARMWMGTNVFYVETDYKYQVPAPSNLEKDEDNSSSSIIALKWTGVSIADLYEIYRDNVKVGETLGSNTNYLDTPGDNTYHTYYVKAKSGSNLSFPSNYIVAVAK